MDDDFNYRCRRRSVGLAIEENLGAGSGGEWYDGSHDHHYDGGYQVTSPGISLMTKGLPDATEMKNLIMLLAKSSEGFGDAAVCVHGDSFVRITTGPANVDIPVYEVPKSGGGFRVEVELDQVIGLYHGSVNQPGGGLEMSTDGIMLTASEDGTIRLKSPKSILLTVGGTSSIELTPDGIVLKGPMIEIN